MDAVDGPNVRVIRHDDGSRSVFYRSPDNRMLVKKTYQNGTLTLVTQYNMGPHDNLVGCKIFDGRKQELFKVRYGYDKNTGYLVAEDMFDSRVYREDPNTGKEMPVRKVRYTYDSEGNRSAPIVLTTVPGKTAKEVFDPGPSAPVQNLFNDGPTATPPVNPNARPVGR